jgi:peptidoglycan/LPS O-acetylase OafA/YrhL
MPARKALRLPYLDGLRAVAALYVVLHHIYLHFHSEILVQIAPALKLLAFGRLAVVLFIVLSGYCLMLPLACQNGENTQHALTFYLRRAQRILPPYYAALFFSVLCIVCLIGERTGTHWDGSLPLNSHALVTRLLLLQDWTGGGAINHVFWSIAVEAHLYLLFPLAIWGWRRFGSAAIVGATGVGCILLAESPSAALLGDFPIGFAFYFVLGMGAAWLAHTPSSQPILRRLPALPLLVLGMAIEVVLLRRWDNDFRTAITETLFALISALLLLTLAKPQESTLRGFLLSKPLVTLGGFSYSLYLIHAPLIQIAWKWGVRPFGLAPLPAFWLLCALAMPFSLITAYGFFLLFERPFLSRKRTERVPIAAPN